MSADDLARRMTGKLEQTRARLDSVLAALRTHGHGPLLAPVTQVLATDVIELVDLAARLDALYPDEQPERPVYEATATQEGHWWAVEIHGMPENTCAVTQGRDREHAKDMAHEVVGLLLDIDETTYTIDMTFINEKGEQV